MKDPDPPTMTVSWFWLHCVPSESIVATPGMGGDAEASPRVSWAPPEIDSGVHP